MQMGKNPFEFTLVDPFHYCLLLHYLGQNKLIKVKITRKCTNLFIFFCSTYIHTLVACQQYCIWIHISLAASGAAEVHSRAISLSVLQMKQTSNFYKKKIWKGKKRKYGGNQINHSHVA